MILAYHCEGHIKGRLNGVYRVLPAIVIPGYSPLFYGDKSSNFMDLNDISISLSLI